MAMIDLTDNTDTPRQFAGHHVPIKMISIWQPFASLMLYDKVEVRAWPTTYRGKVLICSTQTPFERQPKEKRGKIKFYPSNQLDMALCRMVEKKLSTPGTQVPNTFELCGYAIALGTLVDCRKTRITDKSFYAHDLDVYAHIYQDVKRIVPFEIKGFQGMYRNIPEEARTKIELL